MRSTRISPLSIMAALRAVVRRRCTGAALRLSGRDTRMHFAPGCELHHRQKRRALLSSSERSVAEAEIRSRS
jgi:hypothetical protein